MRVRLIASDLDGTLVPAGGRASGEVLGALEEAGRQGVVVVPASGRTLSAFPKEILGLSCVRYIISSNGAVVTDRAEGRRIREVLIPAPVAAEILERLSHYETYTCVYCNNQPYNWRKLPAFLSRYYRDLSFFRRNPKEDLAAFVEENGCHVEKIFTAVGSSAEKQRIRSEFSGLPGIRLTTSSSWNLEFNRTDADKGKALAWLGGLLHIGPEHMLAMGDNENDHTMLQYAGLSLAPENATGETKALVTHVVPDCRFGGAAGFLREWVLEGGGRRHEEIQQAEGGRQGVSDEPG